MIEQASKPFLQPIDRVFTGNSENKKRLMCISGDTVSVSSAADSTDKITA